jgi:hypothetical protein
MLEYPYWEAGRFKERHPYYSRIGRQVSLDKLHFVPRQTTVSRSNCLETRAKFGIEWG